MNYDLRLKKSMVRWGAFNLESEIMKVSASCGWNLKFKI